MHRWPLDGWHVDFEDGRDELKDDSFYVYRKQFLTDGCGVISGFWVLEGLPKKDAVRRLVVAYEASNLSWATV